MRTIFKYDIPSAPEFKIALPLFSDVISVQIQNGHPVMWVLHETDNEKVNTVFRIFMTGEPIPPDYRGRWVGTLQLKDIVLHIFQNTVVEIIAEPEKL